MHYSNNDNRLQLQEAANLSSAQKFLSLERGTRGIRLCVRKAATMTRRKLTPFSLPAAAALILGACLSPLQVAKAQLGFDPFAGNASHAEERWASYIDPAVNGTNHPGATTVNGVDAATANAASFNFRVTAANPTSGYAIITGGNGSGNIYSFNAALTLSLTSTYALAASSNTVVFSLKTLGNPLNTAGVLLTLGTGQTVAPRFTNVVNSGTGMGASAQSAFQFDLSSYGGSSNFTIAVPGSDTSVSFSSSQLDATTATYGAQNVVPEPSSVAIVVTALGGLSIAGLRSRRRE